MSSSDLLQRIEAAKKAVLAQVDLLHREFGRAESNWKSDGTRVTPVDIAISEGIFRELGQQFPKDQFFSEELSNFTTPIPVTARFSWVLDPVDGTNNYALGIPHCAIALALCEFGEPVYGVVYDLSRRKLMHGGPGFGMHDGVNPIVSKQYGEINRYKIMFTLSKDLTRDEANALTEQFASDDRLNGEMFSKILSVGVEDNGEDIHNVFVLAPKDASQIDQLLTLRDPKNGSALQLDDEGVILTDKLAELLGIDAGDTVTFSVNEQQYTLPVAAVTENYIYHYIYMSSALYEKTFDTDIMFNTIACAASENMTNFEAFASDWLSRIGSVLSIVNIDSARKSFEETINSINIIILVMLIAAGALAFVVVYNLTNINISERTREIATIKVLGFKHSETNMYIFRENFVMGAVGIVLGGVIGYFLAQFMLRTVEVDMVKFVKDIEATSYLYAVLLTAFYIVMVNLMMTKRMKNISMVESLKAIE
jgi:putative ABC transport system permease protein